MNYNTVNILIHNDEARPGIHSSSTIEGELSLINHCIYTVVSLVLDFKSLMDSPLRSREISERTEEYVAWALLKYMSYQETPSRNNSGQQQQCKSGR